MRDSAPKCGSISTSKFRVLTLSQRLVLPSMQNDPGRHKNGPWGTSSKFRICHIGRCRPEQFLSRTLINADLLKFYCFRAIALKRGSEIRAPLELRARSSHSRLMTVRVRRPQDGKQRRCIWKFLVATGALTAGDGKNRSKCELGEEVAITGFRRFWFCTEP